MSTAAQSLKKPIGVYILAVLFILAPFGNILISFATSGVPGWYHRDVFFSLLGTIHWLDRLWLCLVALTGLLLLKAHKTSWAAAILTLTLVLAVNVYRIFYPPGTQFDYSQVHMWLATGGTFTVLVLAFYFRFPYLDRRAQWFFPVAQRYDLRTAVQVLAHDIFEGVTESISTSGARIRLQQDLGPANEDLRFVDVIFPAIRNIKLTGEIVEYRDNILRIRYRHLSVKERAHLVDWLKSQNETKAEG